MKLTRIPPDSIPTVAIDLEAPAIERWYASADSIGEESHAAFERVEELAEDLIESSWLPAKLRWVVRPLLNGSAHSIRMLTRFFGIEYAEELRGFARAVDLPYGLVLAANLIYDLTVAMDEAAPSACSSFSCPGPKGGLLLGRNLDWNTPEDIGTHTISVIYHRRKEHYISIGVAGYLGVLTAMRPGYWAMNLNQAPRATRRFNWTGLPVGQHLRWACDHSLSYPSLVRNITAYQTLQPFFAHTVGCRTNQHTVVEGFGDSYHVRKPIEDFLIQTNHYVTPDFHKYNVHQYTDDQGMEWVYDSAPRYETLQSRLTKRFPTNPEECLKYLRPPVGNENTCQSIGMHPASGSLALEYMRP